MLTVNTYLAPSAVHGIGLFATDNIPAGTPVWKFNSHIDKVFSPEEFCKITRELNHCSLRHFLNSVYRRGGLFYYLTDNARFINHCSDKANVAFADDCMEIATRDIQAHEELLEDYVLAYDRDDYFFQEFCNPDPQAYVLACIRHEAEHAYS